MSDLILNEKAQRLFDYLMEIPVDLVTVEHYLCVEALTADEVTRAAIAYADKCFLEGRDWETDNQTERPQGIIPALHSTQLVEIIALLLHYGLQPNAVIEGENIMYLMQHIDNELLAADALALLLENGGDPALAVNGPPMIDDLNFEVSFAAAEMWDRHLYNAIVHMWMVLTGYMALHGKLDDSGFTVFREEEPAERTGDPFDLSKLREHRNYYFGLTKERKEPVIHIYDKRTQWEVARV